MYVSIRKLKYSYPVLATYFFMLYYTVYNIMIYINDNVNKVYHSMLSSGK